MVFHWNISDSKFPKVSRTLRSILADLNNAVVWMVSTHPIISKSSSPCSSSLVTVPSAPITVTFMFHSFLSSRPRFSYLFPFSLSFSFILLSARTANPLFGKFSLLLSLLLSRLILQNGFRIVQIPIVRMVKFKLLAQFSMDYLPHPVVSCLILSLC